MTQAPNRSGPFVPPDGDLHRSVRDWVAAWGDEVADADLAAGRGRFDPTVVAFGTHADVVHGLDALHDQQWSNVWPTISGFHFLVDDLVVQSSPDGLLAVAVVGWGSTGYAADGEPFERPGRATIVLARAGEDTPWRGIHTHFSLGRDVPSISHGATAGRPRTSGSPTSESRSGDALDDGGRAG